MYTFEDICPPVYRHIVWALEFVRAPSDSELILGSNSESNWENWSNPGKAESLLEIWDKRWYFIQVYNVWFQQILRITLKARNKHPSFEDEGSWVTKKLHILPKQTSSVSGEPEFEPLSVGLQSPCFSHSITLPLSKPLFYFIHSKSYSTFDSIQYARIWIDKILFIPLI